MAVLPKNLSMVVQRLANFNRQTIRVRPMSNDRAGPGQTMVFRFPSNTIIDLHNLMIKATLHSTFKGVLNQTIINDDANTADLDEARDAISNKNAWGELNMPRYTQALFERVDVTVGGTTISGSNVDYGGIYTILRDALASSVAKRPAGELDNSMEDMDMLVNRIHMFSDQAGGQTNVGKGHCDYYPELSAFKQSAGGTPYTMTAMNQTTPIVNSGVKTYDGCEFKYESTYPAGMWKTEPVVFDGFLGFLGGKFVRFIDTSITGAIEIRIRLAPLAVTWGPQAWFKGDKTLKQGQVSPVFIERTGAYYLDDLYLMLDTISFTDDFYRQLLARRLIEGGSIVIPYDNYFSTNKIIGSTGDQVTFNVATQSLDYLVGTLRRADYNANPASVGVMEAEVTQKIADSAYYNGNVRTQVSVRTPSYNSRYYTFTSGCGNNLTGTGTYQWLVANQLIPSWPADVNDVWLLNQAALDLTNQISDVGLAERHYEFRRGRFAHIASFAHHAETEKFISGLDTRGASSNMQWMVMGLPSTIDPIKPGEELKYNATVWACCTSTIEISAGQNITVIF